MKVTTLTKRELGIAKGVARGKPYKQLAKEMGLCVGSICNAMNIIYSKTESRGIARLTHWAIKNNHVRVGDVAAEK